ncbi:hypothetical protein [Prescottella equi]|uniref:hypothetical protein n=1 Tax=Rhodococcus hoagii TaxID=43767 RepID=UPI00111C6EE8|nr:hypothetical protein [Prescottella equi]
MAGPPLRRRSLPLREREIVKAPPLEGEQELYLLGEGSAVHSAEDVLNTIAALGRGEVQSDEESFVLTLGQNSISVDRLEFEERLRTALSLDQLDGPSVTTGRSVEILVQSAVRRPLGLQRDNLKIVDESNNLEYEYGTPSPEYLIYLVLQISKLDLDSRGRGRHFALRSSNLLRSRDLEFFEYLYLLLRVDTLQIRASKVMSKADWKAYSESFFFHIGYTMDLAVMPQRNLDEVIRRSRISNTRRFNSVELDAPRRHYVPDLVYHYQLGVSTESPMLAFISYYHVIEHWFEHVYHDDLTAKIQQTLTSPSFSYKRKKDVRGLIRLVSKAVQQRDNELVINEQVALRLTLERYLDLPSLAADLNSFDASLISRYATGVVEFSGGDVVDISDSDRARVIDTLSRRIYKTRNAIIHSKDGSKSKFVPFDHDRQLELEVPLLRFISEQIIISTSVMP